MDLSCRGVFKKIASSFFVYKCIYSLYLARFSNAANHNLILLDVVDAEAASFHWKLVLSSLNCRNHKLSFLLPAACSRTPFHAPSVSLHVPRILCLCCVALTQGLFLSLLDSPVSLFSVFFCHVASWLSLSLLVSAIWMLPLGVQPPDGFLAFRGLRLMTVVCREVEMCVQ